MPPYTRREAVAMLLSAVSTLSLAPLAGCNCGRPGGTRKEDTDADTERERPDLDPDRLNAGLTAALAGSPWADRVEGLIEDVTAELEALREAGYEDTADTATYVLNGFVANVSGAFGEVLAQRTAMEQDHTELGEAVMAELADTCVAVRAVLPGATEEIGEALGSDTVPACDEAAQTMAQDETEIRGIMHEIGTSGDQLMNLLLAQHQSMRAGVADDSSLAASSARLDGFLAGLATDEEVAAFVAGASRRVRLRPISPPPPPPVPGFMNDTCTNLGWISFFVSLASAVHQGVGATAKQVGAYVDDMPSGYGWLRTRYETWLDDGANDAMEGMADLIMGKVKGDVTAMSDKQCNQVAAFLIVVLWFMGLMQTILAFAAAMAGLAGLITPFMTSGAFLLVLVMMAVVILFYSALLMCTMMGTESMFAHMFGECGS